MPAVYAVRREYSSHPGPLSPGDAELLAQTATGDRPAFDRFVERHQAAVLRLLRAGAASEADAEDAFQEAFIAAWRSAASFRGGITARGWILTIARNALHRQYRRRVGEPADFVPLDDLEREAGWGAEDPPDALFERLEDRASLERALGDLAPADREVLVLRDLEQLSGDETVAVLGITLRAMKSRLHRARLRLAAALKEGSRAKP